MKKYPDITPEIVEAFQVTSNNECSDVCRKCGGICCKRMGCEIYPQDVKHWFGTDIITFEMIVKMLDSEYIQLDWWEGDIRDEFGYPDSVVDADYRDRSFYLHMRNKYDAAIDGSYGGMCRALSTTGCIILWDKRPTGGKALVPTTTGKRDNCDSEISKPECCLAWSQYQDILERVFDEYEIPEGETHCDYLYKGIEADRAQRYEIPWKKES